MIHPGVQFKSVEGNALLADADYSEMRSHLGVEAVAVHAEIVRRVAETDQARCDGTQMFHQCGCGLAYSLPGDLIGYLAR